MPSQGVAVVANVQKDSGTIAVVVHAELAGGKGGGKPSLAQAGTKTPERVVGGNGVKFFYLNPR